MKSDREPTNITVRPLNFEAMFARVLAEVKTRDPERFKDVYKLTTSSLGLVQSVDGNTFLLDSEGVLCTIPLSETETADLELYTRSKNEEGKESFGICPVLSTSCTLSELEEVATEPEVNLADFIRSFGQRLEQNYRTIKRFLEVGE